MLYSPLTDFRIVTEEEFPRRINEIEDTVRAASVSGTLMSGDMPLYWRADRVEGARAAVTIVHGFTEFSRKYDELCWYFMNMGYDVYVYDQRGHGLSGRETDDASLAHVNSFDDYVNDLDAVIENVVHKYSPGLPVYLFTHSMGGAVAVLYMCRCPDKVSKVLLSSPMVSPKTHGVPHKAVCRMIRRDAEKNNSWDKMFRYAGHFEENVDFSKAADKSYNRFRHNLDMRIADKRYQNSSSTNRWMTEALQVRDRILDPAALSRVTASVMVIAAEKDGVVCLHPQKKLAHMLGERCRYVMIKGAKHSIYVSGDEILETYINTVRDFFAL